MESDHKFIHEKTFRSPDGVPDKLTVVSGGSVKYVELTASPFVYLAIGVVAGIVIHFIATIIGTG